MVDRRALLQELLAYDPGLGPTTPDKMLAAIRSGSKAGRFAVPAAIGLGAMSEEEQRQALLDALLAQ